MALTDTKIRTAKAGDKPQKLTDAGGLYLEVRPSGAKLWRYRYRIASKENVFALGEYAKEPEGETEAAKAARVVHGSLTLAEARTARDKCRGLVKQGIHPSHNRQAQLVAQVAENANTFEAVSKAWMASRVKWSPYYRKQIERTLRVDAYPYIGTLPMRSITPAHLLAIVERIESRGAATLAILLLQWFSAIFRYAVLKLLADTDPAAALRGAIDRPKVEHKKPLSRNDIPDFMKALNSYGGYRITIIAMRLLMLTFVRPGELRQAEWKEFDLDAALWNVPAERMKMREPHVVPLSAQAVGLLRELHKITGGQDYLFPNMRKPRTCMTITTLNRALERMGYGGIFSAHGFRTTASTILNEMNYRSDVIERQLAHKEKNAIRNAYNRAEYLPERVLMMQDWANLIDDMAKPKSNVTPIKKIMKSSRIAETGLSR